MNKNINKKYDWVIHCIPDVYKKNPLISNWANYHTHGLCSKGLVELSIVAPSNDPRPGRIINHIASLMVEGEKFDVKVEHYIYDDYGNILYNFFLLPTTCFEEESIRIILEDPQAKEIVYPGSNTGTPYVLQFSNIFEIHEK